VASGISCQRAGSSENGSETISRSSSVRRANLLRGLGESHRACTNVGSMVLLAVGLDHIEDAVGAEH
jgi:hypothetical protein